MPDSRTIWRYSEQIARADDARQLFEAFNAQLRAQGLVVHEGAIVVRPSWKSPADNAFIKQGETPAEWATQPRKLARKDRTARWTKKNHQTFYGDEYHVKTDTTMKLLHDYTVTVASVADGTPLPVLVGATRRCTATTPTPARPSRRTSPHTAWKAGSTKKATPGSR